MLTGLAVCVEGTGFLCAVDESLTSMGLLRVEGTLFTPVGLRTISFLAEVALFWTAFTVELDEEVDDSRTGGKPRRDSSSPITSLPLAGGRLLIGLVVRCCAMLLAVAKMPGEYDEAELGVAT
jgi:hypothetical protein